MRRDVIFVNDMTGRTIFSIDQSELPCKLSDKTEKEWEDYVAESFADELYDFGLLTEPEYAKVKEEATEGIKKLEEQHARQKESSV